MHSVSHIKVRLVDLSQVGSAIRSWRLKAGLSQQQLATRLGTTQSAVSRWENGRDEPRLSTLAAILRECELEGVLMVEPGIDRAQLRQQLALTPRQRAESVMNVNRLRAIGRRTD